MIEAFIAWAQAHASDERIAVIGIILLGLWAVFDDARHGSQINFVDQDETAR